MIIISIRGDRGDRLPEHETNPEETEISPIIRLKYFLRIKNVGDRITPDLITRVFGLRTIYYGADAEPHLVGTGSIISATNNQSRVWGTGLMYPPHGLGNAAPEHIYALRGKLTFAEFRKAGLTLADIPLGDPAYLIRDTHFDSPQTKKYRLGLVAHYVDRRDHRVARLLAKDGVTDLNVHADPDDFLQSMSECEAIASSSLHGLIFAEALSIPNVWLHLSDRVVGDGFKFHDWFSMNAKPQQLPFFPNGNEPVSEFVARAELHDCQIDRSALVAAFPRDQLSQLTFESRRDRPFVSLNQCRKANRIPIFVISYNRAEYLERVIASYLRLAAHVQIIIHDNGSDDPAALLALESFEKSGSVQIFHAPKISHPDELNKVDYTIQEFFSQWSEPCRYVVTDCDVDMSTADKDALEVYDNLLDQFRDSECVGPMLTIRDISEEYPLYDEVINRHVEQFWHQQPEWASTTAGKVGFLRAPIDTTFALHRAGETFRRQKPGLRVYYPYEARHLDWYETISSENNYSSSSAPDISHWRNDRFREQHRYSSLRFKSFIYVDQCEDGELVIKTKEITSDKAER